MTEQLEFQAASYVRDEEARMTTRSKRTRRPSSKGADGVTGQPERATPRPTAEPVRAAIQLTDEEISRICIASLQSIRTIERYASGLPVYRTTKVRLERAMAKCGIARREKTPGKAPRRRVVEQAA